MKRHELLAMLDRAGFEVRMYNPDGRLRYQVYARCVQCGEPYQHITLFRDQLNALADAVMLFDMAPSRVCARCTVR
jgi:hypothetical protein